MDSLDKIDYVDTSEAAEILNRSVMSITRWLDKGMFDGAFKDGPFDNSPWRIPRTSVEEVKNSFRPQ